MTRKKAMTDAKSRYDKQIQQDLHAIEILSDASEQKSKMQIMESFINNPDKSEEDGLNADLAQAELDELTASLSD
jgi:hypothetical protein